MKKLILTVGLPGSGKTTYLRNFLAFKNHIIISPDLIREELTGDISDQSQNKKVWDLAYERLNSALKSDYEYIGFDATLIDKSNRQKFLNQIKSSSNIEITVLFLNIKKEDSLTRQESRERKVPNFVLDKFETQFEKPELSEFKNFKTKIIEINSDTPFFNNNRLAFIGDIQSCFQPLNDMLYKLGFWREGNIWYSSSACMPVFLGDLIDRGDDTVGVLKTLIQLHSKNLIYCVQGNHDNKLFRYLKSLYELGPISQGIKNKDNPKKIIINHGLDLTLAHLEHCTENELISFMNFLGTLPKFLQFTNEQRQFVAVHAFWAPWMLYDKKSENLMLYGLSDGYLDNGLPKRISWWELDKYKTTDYIVIAGHYAQKIDLPHFKCADWGACFGNELACYLPGKTNKEDQWITVESKYNYKDEVLSKVDLALDYNQIFNFINDDQLKLINEIENNDQLKKTRYLIEFDNETHEIVVANAKKTLFTPSVTSYSEQVSKGIVYNKTTSEIISITLFKCYNFNENKSVNKKFFELLSDPNLRIECTDKLDGTQIYRFVYKGKVFWGTRSLLISEPNQVEEGNTDFFNLVKETKNFELLNNSNYEPDRTLIFELLHSNNRTIVQYKDEPLLRCLGVSTKENKRWTGQFSPLTCDSQLYPADLLLQTSKIDDAVDLLEKLNKEGSLVEGFVANIVNKQNQVLFRVKFKTDLFFETMRLLTHCTYDNTVELCLANNLTTQDDFISYLKQDKDKFPEELLEQYILFFNQYQEYIMNCNKYIELLQSYYKQLIESNNFANKKDFALFIQNLPFKGFLFSLYDNKKIDLDKTFKYDLKEVINRINELY